MADHRILKYPKSRVATFDVGKIGNRKHHICGLLEIDVTEARGRIKEKIRNGEDISFTSWLIKVIACTINENPYIHAINFRGNSQVAFDSVDISLPLEREVNGVKVPLAALIKNADRLSISEIDGVIREAAKREVRNEKDYVLTERKRRSLTSLFFKLPQALRMLVWKHLLSNPFRIKENMGTAIITNMGMTGQAPGWIIPKSMHNLCFGMGSIVKKPWIVNGEIVPRDILHLTILIDHDTVDGTPAAIFTDKLVKKIQSASQL